MRNILIGLLAVWLVCSPSADTIVSVEVDANGTVSAIGYSVIDGEVPLYDLTTAANGLYVFRARWTTEGGLWSDWSETYTIKKTGRPGNIHIR